MEPDARIARIDLYRAALPLATPLAHSQVATSELDEVILAVSLDDGHVGMSEVRGNGAYATGHDAEEVIAAVGAAAAALVDGPARLASQATLERTGNRLATALVEGAVLDALARRRGEPLWRLLGASGPRALPTHASVAFLPAAEAFERVRSAAAQGFGRFKIRVGSAEPGADAARVAACREAAPGAELAIDANGAWSVDQAKARIGELERYGLAWVEQPVAPGDPDALARVQAAAGVPVVADESVRTADDVAALSGAVRGVHLKLEKCGTFGELREACRIARESGMLVEIGQMDQGRLGSATVAHMASALDADAFELWGFERVERDVAAGLEAEGGAVAVGSDPGNGMTVDLAALEGVATWQ